VRRESAPRWGAPDDRPAKIDQRQGSATLSEQEALQRVHAVTVVLAAIDSGDWRPECDVIDAAVALLQAAASWQLLAELEAAGSC
jgi:hypothetical protein